MNSHHIYILQTLIGSSFFRPKADGTLSEFSTALCPSHLMEIFVSQKLEVRAMRELENAGLVNITLSSCGRKYIVKTAYNAYQEAAEKGKK